LNTSHQKRPSRLVTHVAAMPIGIQRINAKRSHPNAAIVFIKPLKGPDEDVAQEYLERIAAQCCKSAPTSLPSSAADLVIGQIPS